jgi:alpha-glucoside transport system substrate-binding protein
VGRLTLGRFLAPALLALLATTVVAAASAGTVSRQGGTKRVAVLGPWSGAEQRSFEAVLDGFKTENPGVDVAYTSAPVNFESTLQRAIDSGKGPDVAILPQASLLRRFVARRALKQISFARRAIAANYSPSFLDVTSVNGRTYGVVFEAGNKSTVWYSVKAFRDAGTKPPTTFAALLRTARSLRTSGTRAYSISGADGWTLTDLFENIYLRQAGAKRYDQLTRHRIKWTDPSVKAALRTMAKILGDRPNVPGGASGALQTDFAESVSQVFGLPSKAAMVFEGDFVAPVITASTRAKPLTDFDVFPFPTIGRSGRVIVGSNDSAIAVMIRDTPAARSLIGYLATARAAAIWIKRGGFSSPNRRVGLKLYPDPITRKTAVGLTGAKVFRFDLSDLQPVAFGATEGQGELKLLQDFLRNPKNVNGIAAELERAAERVYPK